MYFVLTLNVWHSSNDFLPCSLPATDHTGGGRHQEPSLWLTGHLQRHQRHTERWNALSAGEPLASPDELPIQERRRPSHCLLLLLLLLFCKMSHGLLFPMETPAKVFKMGLMCAFFGTYPCFYPLVGEVHFPTTWSIFSVKTSCHTPPWGDFKQSSRLGGGWIVIPFQNKVFSPPFAQLMDPLMENLWNPGEPAAWYWEHFLSFCCFVFFLSLLYFLPRFTKYYSRLNWLVAPAWGAPTYESFWSLAMSIPNLHW